jgi:hypothetical protein
MTAVLRDSGGTDREHGISFRRHRRLYCLFMAKIQMESVPVKLAYEPGVCWGASASLLERGRGGIS